MNKKSFIMGILVMALVLGMLFVACENGTTSGTKTPTPTPTPSDTWTNVTSMNQLVGTWKATITQTLSASELGVTNVSASMVGDTTLTFTAATMAAVQNITATFTGTGVDSSWSSIKTMINSELSGGATVTFNDTAHTATWTQNIPATATTLSDLTSAGSVQLNSAGSKLKMSFGGSTATFTKQS
jgi:hypothetical protein